MPAQKSVITCDLEGRIETFNSYAEELFGYSKSEIIGHKRVSLFSPGLIVLGHVQNWLKTAREKGEYRSRTVFQRKDGTQFAAEILITPTYHKGKQIGYCGITMPLEDTPISEAMPKIPFMTRLFAWLVVTRAPFLTATIIPIVTGAAWIYYQGEMNGLFPWGLFWLALIGGIAIHISANTFNDYFDWTSGTDKVNNEYFLPYSGGSRSIELGLITERKLLFVALSALGIAALAGLPFLILQGPGLLLFAIVGAFSAYYYTAPPLRLAARRGLGELIVGLNFGPLMTAGTVFALTGQFSWMAFFIGLPIGLLTTAILWINQFPDMIPDALSGKNNLVVVLGKKRARWGYLLILTAAFGSVIAGILLNVLPITSVLALIGIPFGIHASIILFRYYSDRNLIRANSVTILLHSITGLLLAVGILISHTFSQML
jgi:1,4-dihydroxy-2-naphthoate polyprenyltransferase